MIDLLLILLTGVTILVLIYLAFTSLIYIGVDDKSPYKIEHYVLSTVGWTLAVTLFLIMGYTVGLFFFEVYNA